jgi:hypothetical protein
MQMRHFLAIVLALTLICPLVIGSSVENGVDKNPDDSEVPFSIIERTTPSVDGEDWNFEIRIDDDAYANGTTLSITTQVCTNDGVCDPPITHESVAEGQNYAISITPPSDHTYVNWRVGAEYENGDKENFPQGDWFKTWSSCWFNEKTWGGIDSTDDGCESTEEGILPGFVLPTMLASMMLAVAYYRRD